MTILGLTFLASNQALAYDCSSAQSYSDNDAYTTGAIARNGNEAYQCTEGGWCTIGGPYAPGDGWAWENSWVSLGACDSTGGSNGSGGGAGNGPSYGPVGGTGGGGGGQASCAAWSTNGNYDVGDIVEYQGSFYIAENSNPGYDPIISSWFWEPTASCANGGGNAQAPVPASAPAPAPAPAAGGGNTDNGGGQAPSGGGFSAIVSEAQFDQMFPGRDPFYTYQGLAEAAATFPAFVGTGSDTVKRREAAAALANFSHETGGLVYIEEIAKNEYCSDNATPCGVCAPGKQYFGRGPTQLSWNFNYCAAGQALGLDLWENPDQVAQNPTTAWQTALWFWMTQTGAGTRTAHDGITSGAGFGETIRTINGALECNGGVPAQVQSRISIYQNFTQILNTTPGDNLGC